MSAIGVILIIFGLIGIITNGVQFYHSQKIQREMRKELGKAAEEITDGLAPLSEHNKSQLIFSLAMLGVGLLIFLR